MNAARPIAYWFRRDLRLADNPALLRALEEAATRQAGLLPVFVWESADAPGSPGAAGRWWLSRSLAALDAELRRRGSRLTLLRGEPATALATAAAAAAADAVVWARGLDPAEQRLDKTVAAELRRAGIAALIVPSANLLHDPAAPLTRTGGPYTVFTPFWKARLALPAPKHPLPAPATLPPPPPLDDAQLPTESRTDLERIGAEAGRPWTTGFAEVWQPGEAGGSALLARFVTGALERYATDRDRPDLEGSSRLSPHLHWGEVGGRQVWAAVAGALAAAGQEAEAALAPFGGGQGEAPGLRASAGAFLRQLGWREFAHHLLHHHPRTLGHPLHERFAAFPWRDDAGALEAWRRGRTGYPLVDAGMRELWTTGWMHNRARLVAASFLVKHLLLPWRLGQSWFRETLVDADDADNALGWQWVAGSGADAAPYFRIFNPVLQGRRYDPRGDYVRRWVPELAGLPARTIQAPWTAPAADLAAAEVRLGHTYPEPIVDHGAARRRALAAYEEMLLLTR